MAKLLLGKPVADLIDEGTRARAEALRAAGVQPTLAIVRVGERPDDLSYERSACKRAESLGIAVRRFALPADASQADAERAIGQVNADGSIHGCLLFRPLPKTMDEQAVCNALCVGKDVDGITAGSLAGVFMGTGEGFAPCTAQACVEILRHYDVPVEGKSVVVVGRSLVIGKPVAMLLLERNATVTLAHSRSRNVAELCRAADVVVCATGRPRAYTVEHFANGQVVLDVGINVDDEGNLCGDVDFAAAESVVDAITPVPRGVGSVTTAVLMSHVVEAAERAAAVGCAEAGRPEAR